MAGAILIGNRSISNKGDLGLSESMSSNLALSFGDTIIPVLEKNLPEVVPEITFIYEFGDTIDFRSLDRTLFNKTMLILQEYFNNLIVTEEDNYIEYSAKTLWNYLCQLIEKDERYDPNFKFE